MSVLLLLLKLIHRSAILTSRRISVVATTTVCSASHSPLEVRSILGRSLELSEHVALLTRCCEDIVLFSG